jgi:Cellulose binding domain
MTIGFPQPRVRALIIVSALILSGLGGCSSGGKSNTGTGGKAGGGGATTTGSGGKGGTAGTTTSSGGQIGTDAGAADHPTTSLAALGAPCTKGADCASTFCADGVCCNSACDGICVTCDATNNVGTCLPAEVNSDPRDDCKDEGATSCGKNGTCDGTGSCQLYVAGVVCQAAGCTGSALTFAGRCDGMGTCKAQPNQSCAPYVCNTSGANAGSCKTVCTADADCSSGNSCNNGSCGLKPPGASCSANADCMSTHCAQGVCCSTACTGTCMSCAIAKSQGTCIAVPQGQDPLGQCADQGAMSCLTDGFCDGKGACEDYAAGTSCGPDMCSAGTETPGGKCDGKGTCQPGTATSCGAYICGTSGDCKTSCAKDADCASGYVCNGTICGKKVNGVTCTTAAECGSGYCEQGVCCNTGCEATCQSCNLSAATAGTCTNVPTGQDPLNQCADAGAATCGTNGSCDGAGKCQLYGSGTVCLAQSCTGSTVTAASRCDGAGKCVAGSNSTCSPYNCGSTACLTSCGGNTDCVSPNVCTAMSCGKYPIGAACSANADCSSNFCAQGYCCNTACTGACQSCALTSSIGTCTNVPAGQDPLSQCTDAGAASCGNNGFCNGAGACQKYAAGTQCAAATCSGSTYTAASTCNGTGTCATPAGTSCGAFACDATTKICKIACTADTDCTSPNICNAGTCTLAPLGHACTAGTACASGLCQQGVCCSSSCSGTCASCALTGTLGTCTNIAAGTDPLSACTDAGIGTCGTDGTCDGSGKCRLYASGTVCAAQSCAGSTFTPTRTCDGTGVCKTVTSSLCAPYACDTTNNVCKTSCAATADCASPNTCNTTTMSCGLQSQGAPCTADNQCVASAAHCQQGVCCATTCTANCSSCAIAGSLGTCVSVPAGQDPLAQCTDAGTASCGTDGYCDGGGNCRKYASGTTCIAQSCSTSTYHPASTCNGTGTCQTPTTSSCTPFICGTNACKTSCTTNSDCISAAYMCSAGSCIQAVNLTVKLYVKNLGTPWVAPQLSITNNGPSALPLSGLSLRYWYDEEATDGTTVVPTCNTPAQTAFCDSTSMAGGCNSTTGAPNFSWAFVNAGKTNADCYYALTFSSSAGSLAVNASIGDIELRFSKNDFSPMVQSNDYSNNGATVYTTTTKVTAYINSTTTPVLVYGTEPL